MSAHQANRSKPQPAGLLIGTALILCLFLIRFFMVAESAANGDSLWIIALWFAELVIWTAISWRSQKAMFGWLDLCIGLFVTAHIVSALSVIATSGDRRSALNLAWEWVGIAVAWLLLRQQSRQAAFRRELVVGLIATGTAVAGLGLYQHYIDFPRMAAKYGPLFDRLKHADATEAASIRQTLAREHIPVEGPSLVLFEKRLRDSREPLGLFALANTLGGFLAVCLVLSVSIAVSQRRTVGDAIVNRCGAWIPIIAILGLCLVLTKSRTAWIGTATGLASLAIGSGLKRLNRIQLRAIAGSLVAVGLIGWGLIRFGGLDRQVLTEAPKSLKYRLQYWSATWPMIKDHLCLGVGPGQFRAHYLFYKLPEASEEISDPHNLFLDTAANGGIVAVFGLIALCVMVVLRFRSAGNAVDNSEIPSDDSLIPYTISAFAAVGWLILLVTGEDDRLLVLLPIVVALIWGIRRLMGHGPGTSRAIQVGSLSAAFALLVHLGGAGGIGMPVVTLLLLALVAIGSGASSTVATTQAHQIPTVIDALVLSDGHKTPAHEFGPRNSVILSGGLFILGLGLTIVLFLTGLRPVWASFKRTSSGDQFVERGLMESADSEYAAAADADPFSEEPWRRRAELVYRRAESEQFRFNDSFRNAVRLMRESSRRDPVNFQQDRRLGDWWLARWQVTKQTADAQEAVAAFRRAWAHYPTNAWLMAELAFALEAAGDTHDAAAVAVQATHQDDINHQCGHVDRYLPDAVRARLDRLATAGVLSE